MMKAKDFFFSLSSKGRKGGKTFFDALELYMKKARPLAQVHGVSVKFVTTVLIRIVSLMYRTIKEAGLIEDLARNAHKGERGLTWYSENGFDPISVNSCL